MALCTDSGSALLFTDAKSFVILGEWWDEDDDDNDGIVIREKAASLCFKRLPLYFVLQSVTTGYGISCTIA